MNFKDCSFQSFQVVLSLALYSFLPHMHWSVFSCSSKGDPQQISRAFLCVALCLILCPVNSSHLGLPRQQTPSFKETTGLCLGYYSWFCILDTLSEQQPGAITRPTLFASVLSGIIRLCSLMSSFWKDCFIYFDQLINSFSVTPSCLRLLYLILNT